jgi:hypothetical protein
MIEANLRPAAVQHARRSASRNAHHAGFVGALRSVRCARAGKPGEGVTLDQLSIVLDQMLLEWSRTAPHIKRVWAIRRAAKGARVQPLLAKPGTLWQHRYQIQK